MHRYRLVSQPELRAEATAPRPLGPGFTPAEADQADTMEIWRTNLLGGGPAYTRFDLKQAGKVVKSVLIPGYTGHN